MTRKTATARKIIMDDDDDEIEQNPDEMQVESEDEVEVEAEEDANDQQEDEEGIVDVEDEEGSEKEDELEEEELEDESELDALSSPPPDASSKGAPHPKLKIKLKLPTFSTANTATPTPEGTSRAASRRGASRDVDIESEDSDEDSTVSGAATGRALTARQAVLRNVVDSSHVSLIEPPNPRKKPPLTEIEIALKREETARKRKNLSEKKLEDEKAETINRLLKKQSRSKGRRNALATAEDRDTPVAVSRGEAEDEDGQEGSMAPVSIIPTMYRWVSSVRTQGDEKQMALSFSVPVSVIPAPSETESDDMKMDIEPSPARFPTRLKRTPLCDVQGCFVARKYRLMKDQQRGACSMDHLKVLESQLVS